MRCDASPDFRFLLLLSFPILHSLCCPRTHTKKVFGANNGAKIYGVLFTAFAVASISGTFLTKVRRYLLLCVALSNITHTLAFLNLMF